MLSLLQFLVDGANNCSYLMCDIAPDQVMQGLQRLTIMCWKTCDVMRSLCRFYSILSKGKMPFLD